MGYFSEMDLNRRSGADPFVPMEEQPAFVEAQNAASISQEPTESAFTDAFDDAALNDADAALSFAPDTSSDEEEPKADVPKAPAEAPKVSADDDEDAKRKAHEEAEAKRKAEWEAKQQEKKAAMQAQIDQIASMSDEEVMASSMQRIGADTERLTRRNMKECISEHIQTLCVSDPAFARMAMHPRKSMIHCIWYINRKAQEYAEHEMKDNGIKPDRNGIYGCDVPDDLCYQWAEEYFRDPNAKEDQEEEEKFVPKPYTGKAKTTSKSSAKGKAKKEAAKPAEKKPAVEKKPEPLKTADVGQMTLGDFAMMGASA